MPPPASRAAYPRRRFCIVQLHILKTLEISGLPKPLACKSQPCWRCHSPDISVSPQVQASLSRDLFPCFFLQSGQETPANAVCCVTGKLEWHPNFLCGGCQHQTCQNIVLTFVAVAAVGSGDAGERHSAGQREARMGGAGGVRRHRLPLRAPARQVGPNQHTCSTSFGPITHGD